VISVATPTYRTSPEVLARTWASLKAQTHTDWQWVVWDDSPDDHTWRHLWGLAADERYRLIAHRSMVPSGGNIGRVKRQAFMAAEGDILVELDHDDELTPDALALVVEAFTDPEVGFVYSDWCEINPAGESCRYPEGWAFGYGSDYWSEEHKCWVMRAPEINRTTMSHIVSAPNHVRAWRASVYAQIGGHDPSLVIADDYDLCVRTILATNWVHIPRMIYRQHIGAHTAQRQRNELIQTLVAEISQRYASQLDADERLRCVGYHDHRDD
jgi:glycosyltransferase involved in cell wall biosynthesis